MTLKYLAAGVAAAALVGAAAAGVTSIASPVAQGPNPALALVNNDVLLPMQPVADVPTVEQLQAVLNGLGAPGVPFRSKGQYVEGGIGITYGALADRYFEDKYPLTFVVGPPSTVVPGLATSTVTVTGTAFGPITQEVTFVDQGGWKLSRSSVETLVSSAGY